MKKTRLPIAGALVALSLSGCQVFSGLQPFSVSLSASTRDTYNLDNIKLQADTAGTLMGLTYKWYIDDELCESVSRSADKVTMAVYTLSTTTVKFSVEVSDGYRVEKRSISCQVKPYHESDELTMVLTNNTSYNIYGLNIAYGYDGPAVNFAPSPYLGVGESITLSGLFPGPYMISTYSVTGDLIRGVGMFYGGGTRNISLN
jgi:hypothetical protein